MSTPTAVITGSTAGLGAAFARQLAAQGYGLVLVARDGERLRDQAHTLNRRYGIPVSVIVADLVTDDGVGAVQERLADPHNPVHLLINNAGHGLATEFIESDLDQERDLLRLHVQTPMDLTHTAARAMVRRRAGRIINVASVAGFAPTGTYSAAKSWVINFSKALHQQLRGDGVMVTALCPGLVRTEFHERSGITIRGAKKWMWLEADEVVRQGLAANAQGSAVSVPSRSYQMLTTSMRFMPDSMVKWAVNRRMGAPGHTEDDGQPGEDPKAAQDSPPPTSGTATPARTGGRPPALRPRPRPKTEDDPDDDGTAEPTTGAIRTVNAYKAAKVTFPAQDEASAGRSGPPAESGEPEASTDEITTVEPGEQPHSENASSASGSGSPSDDAGADLSDEAEEPEAVTASRQTTRSGKTRDESTLDE